MKRRSGTGSTGGRWLWLPCILSVLWSPAPAFAQLQNPALPHYDVVALRVEFSPDTTRFTTGDGTYDGPFYPGGFEPKIDPLPHDAAYFEAHLAFLEDYVHAVSDGQTTVTTHLIEEVVQLPAEMGTYSPVGLEADSDEERRNLVRFIVDAWGQASSESAFDPSALDPDQTAFLIFHAGAGRDVELVGTALDKTPLDLPSVFFSPSDLARLGGGNILFKSMPVRQTAILPRTESRPGFNYLTNQVVLLELSINGLLAASFFNFLGVPDLFNTATGESAIGPYGLMDAEGIFAYAGLFPPEPSPWTKYYVGWVEPMELTGIGPEEVSIAAAGLHESGVARIAISEAEYFLVENRHRDPGADGLVLRIWDRGVVREEVIEGISDDFNRFTVSGFTGGVVVGVDNYDFALPGRDADGVEYDGGILVWHVDERVIEAGIPVGRVNSDPGRRGVDLEEADSAQEIGFDNYRGSPFDFWWEGNPVGVLLSNGSAIELYENRFSPTTVPDSRTNAGGASFVTLESFSKPAPVMTFTYRLGRLHGIEPGPSRSVEAIGPVGPGSSVGEGNGFTLVHHGPPTSRVYIVRDEGGGVQAAGALSRPVITKRGFAAIDREELSSRLVLREWRVASVEPIALERERTLQEGTILSGQSLVRGDHAMWALLVHGTESILVRLDDDGHIEETSITGIGAGIGLSLPPGTPAQDGEQPILVGRSGAQGGGGRMWSYAIGLDEEVGTAVFGREAAGVWGVVPLVERGELLALLPDGSTLAIEANRYCAGRLGSDPALVDLDADGTLEIVTTIGVNLVAFTRGGALASGFPISLAAPSAASPVIAELTDSGGPSIIVAAEDGEVYSFDMGDAGQAVPGFPLSAGARVEATPILRNNRLQVVTTSGELRSWTLSGAGYVAWGERHADAANTGYVEAASEKVSPPSFESLLAIEETYNWPNPVRDGQTFFRVMTVEDADVRIRIVDAAGSLLDEFEFSVPGGSPTEHLWETNAESGIYYARVLATTASGQKATKLVTIAVIR